MRFLGKVLLCAAVLGVTVVIVDVAIVAIAVNL